MFDACSAEKTLEAVLWLCLQEEDIEDGLIPALVVTKVSEPFANPSIQALCRTALCPLGDGAEANREIGGFMMLLSFAGGFIAIQGLSIINMTIYSLFLRGRHSMDYSFGIGDGVRELLNGNPFFFCQGQYTPSYSKCRHATKHSSISAADNQNR